MQRLRSLAAGIVRGQGPSPEASWALVPAQVCQLSPEDVQQPAPSLVVAWGQLAEPLLPIKRFRRTSEVWIAGPRDGARRGDGLPS